MSPTDLRTARTGKGLTQAQAAVRLGVSQPYVAMLERGERRLTPRLARRVARLYGLSPTAVPPSGAVAASRGAADLARDLAALGDPGFAHIRPRRWVLKDPGGVLLVG